ARVVLRNCGNIDPQKIDDYISVGGYSALAKVLHDYSHERIIEEMKESGLRGRGGAGFPTWLKWDFTRQATGEEKYVLCNADEGDPGAFMDRSVLEGDPHSLIEGMAIAAYTVGAQRGFVYVRAEYPLAVARFNTALQQAREAGLLGERILGSDFSFDLEIRMGSGAFVCGEETALINSIEGKRGEPRPRPPFPAQKGLWGKPSLLNNVETYTNVPAIISRGASWYSSFGTEESKGTKVFALAGAINISGLVEVPIGTSLGELIYDIGGGIPGGKSFKAAQIGGPSGGCIPKEYLNVPLDYNSLAELGAIMGSGGLIVMDEDTCMVDVARYFLEFVQEESCGKCTPCRVGIKRMLEILDRITSGQGEEEDIQRLIDLGEQIKDTALCGLGQTAPNPVLSTIRHFRHEYEDHIRHKHCEAGICPSLVKAPCQSSCPAAVDVPGFISLVGEKRYAEALRLHRERNPFAAVCARVCFHTCEEKCRRSSIDDPVAIRAIKRFMVDQEVTIQLPEIRENEANARRKIAIVGAGPAGLSCAYFLARLGYRPTIFEAESRPGGMMVQTIPAYRLPRETLAREIRMIENMGTTIVTDTKLGRDFSLEDLRDQGYEAVFLGPGAPKNMEMGIPGEDAEGVVQGIDFLKQYNIRGSVPVGKKIVVIGGGNAAIDAARTALRLGAEEVSILYRRTKDQMPAYAEEIEDALLEGIKLKPLTQPIAVEKDDQGRVRGLTCACMSLGDFDRSGRRRPTQSDQENFFVEADQIIVAIGQRLETEHIFGNLDVHIGTHRFIATDPISGQTSVPWIFAGGDAASGPVSVVSAIAEGERGAVGIDQYLTGEQHAFWRREKVVHTNYDPDADPVPYPREKLPVIAPDRRANNFDEVERGWCESVAIRQCERCLRCDYGKITVSMGEEI
ncbi:MAG TPA: NADH-quinone oxidoreductase subunit NuoF, partial [Sediminispirochaeta sp.]|nr:NADH-quinone oxidoreductase subunit NuoF [Sediminispirochaeta sp.]